MVVGITDEALGCLTHPEALGPTTSVHEARKRCKELRGLLRLVRSGLGPVYRPADDAVRDAARLLSPIRDAQELLATFEALADAGPSGAPGNDLADVRGALEHGAERATASVLGEGRERVTQAMALLVESRDVALSVAVEDDLSAVSEGVIDAYRRARRAMDRAAASGDSADYHRWRKHTKYLWSQVRLIEAWSPSLLGTLPEPLKELSDLLGDAHDLVVLADRVARMGPTLGARQRKATRRRAARRRADLEKHARRLGARVFEDDTDAFAARLEASWIRAPNATSGPPTGPRPGI